MAALGADAVPRLSRRTLLLTLFALGLVAAWFILRNAIPYTNYDPVTYDDLWSRRYGLIPHLLGGSVAILVGVVQLWLGFTGRMGALHRRLGRLYVGGIAVASAGAFYLALTIPQGNFAYSSGLFLLAVVWVLTTSMALWAVKQRAIEQHREWMIRSYVVTFAFVTFRLVGQVINHWHLVPAMELDAFLASACWSVPLVLAEPLIQMRKVRRL